MASLLDCFINELCCHTFIPLPCGNYIREMNLNNGITSDVLSA